MLIINIAKIWGIIDDKQPKTPKQYTPIFQSTPPENCYLLIENGTIKKWGSMKNLTLNNKTKTIDAQHSELIPGFCDSHTHAVFTGSRENELLQKLEGLDYFEIKKRGGGILATAQKMASMKEKDLLDESYHKILNLIKLGTTALEIKSGYGLNKNTELKSLRVINQLKKILPIPIKSTFLALHAKPNLFKTTQEYYNYVVSETLPVVLKQKLADYLDLFCEKKFFKPAYITKLAEIARNNGLKLRVHTNQFNSIGGIKAAINAKAFSIDHLEQLNDKEKHALIKDYSGFCTLLPGVSFYLDLPYAPAKYLIENGLNVNIASDFNPGSCPSGNMGFMFVLACLKYKLTPLQALETTTFNGAKALEIHQTHGSITIGKKANFCLLKPNHTLNKIPYYFSTPFIDKVFINGTLF